MIDSISIFNKAKEEKHRQKDKCNLILLGIMSPNIKKNDALKHTHKHLSYVIIKKRRSL